MQLCSSLSILWHCLSLGLKWKQAFSRPVATAEFFKFAGILSAVLSQHSSFRIWNSWTGIPSPPLALFIVMLPKAHLTLHSRMSGSRWVITPLWLSGSWRSFLYSSSVYSCHLFLVTYGFVRSISFLSFIVPIFAWNIPLVSLLFLKRSLVFPILLLSSIFCTDHWKRLSYLSWLFFGTMHSNGNIFDFFLCLSRLFFSQLFVKPPQTTILPFCIFSPLGMVLITASCTVSRTSIHSSSGTLSDLIPECACHFHCIIIRDLI